MKTRSIFLLVAFLIFLPFTSQAQLRNIRKVINKQFEQKVDSSAEKNKEKEGSDNNSGQEKSGRGLFGGKIDIKYNDQYNFTGRIYMQMEQYNKDEVTKMDYYTYYSSNAPNAGIEVKAANVKEKDKDQAMPTVFIFDDQNRCFLVLTEGPDSKTGIISAIPSDSAMAAQSVARKAEKKDQSKADAERATVTRTGNTRMIAGYKCEEYKIVPADKDGSANVWMTKDVKLKADNKYWGKAGIPSFTEYPEFKGAFMLAMESFDKDNKAVMKMETKEINNSFDHSISTVGFTLIKLNFGSAGKR